MAFDVARLSRSGPDVKSHSAAEAECRNSGREHALARNPRPRGYVWRDPIDRWRQFYAFSQGDLSAGVVILGGEGAINSTVGAVTTGSAVADGPNPGSGSGGVVIQGTGTINSTSGLIRTFGDNALGLVIVGGEGSITARTAGLTTVGGDSTGALIFGHGPVSFTNTGTINVSGDNSIGIDVDTIGTGTVNVTTGVVTHGR